MDVNFPKLEEDILARWKGQKAFEKSVALRLGRRKGGLAQGKRFVFYDGPPTANGLPGIHHVLNRVFKDIILRYKTMRGFFVPRKAGWDTHGLPVELQIEKKLGLKSKKDIEQYGIAKFNEECRKSVWEYKKEWEKFNEKVGLWIDMDHPYITYETSYIEILWSLIKKFWQKKLLYKDYKVVPFCTRCGTALSSHELAQGYKTVEDQSVYVKFTLSSDRVPSRMTGQIPPKTFILSWTTTPWTLPGNVALAVGEQIEYALAQKDGEQYILAKDLAQKVLGGHQVLKTFIGKDLVGLSYEPLFDIKTLQNEKSHKIYSADFVTTTDGTGVVHTAVMYGEDDYALGKKVGLPQHHTVDEQGKFTNEVGGGLAGLFVKAKETDEEIFTYLKEHNNFFATQSYSHEYPFCWRCSTPLLYYAKDSWFINMQKVKKELLLNNEKVNWVPEHIKHGRMGEWLKEVKDWAFSRERYWGTPLPIWQCVGCKVFEVVGSLKELLKKKFSSNSYFIMRHGYTERNKTNTMSCWPEKMPFPLLQKGIQQALKAAQQLRNKKIDLLFSSDLLRTKQTAEIVGRELGIEPIFDERLREWNTGTLNGRPITDLGKIWGKKSETSTEHYLRRFVDPMPQGESYVDVRKRMYEFVKELNKKYSGKHILIISHELPLTLVETTVRGFSREEAVAYREKQKNPIKTGEWRPLLFALLPYNEQMEIDLHKPHIDEVFFECSFCKNAKMKRVKEVVDVWFDSGAMPFASASPFPADYIVEGIDQTRGWFYTLLAVSTLLGFKSPYKNAIALSHVLDAKGEKMSKSKGNVVNPWDMIQKYGIDAVRWYFYTINNPGEPKLFSEKDIQETIRRFLLTFWNSYVFYKTYKPKRKYKIQNTKYKIQNVLDRWIVSRLNGVTKEVTEKLDAYDITGAGRAIENFVVNDLSLWYIRRSRPRFQNPKNAAELKNASKVLGCVLLETAKLCAPFIPFLSEYLYGEMMGKKNSIHWENWPLAAARGKSSVDKKLEEQMIWVRDIVAKALAERAKLVIRVRQPLASLKIQNTRYKIQDTFLDLIKDEVNVKEIIFDKNLKQEVEFDTNITQELKEEGMFREIMRQIQGMRKEAGYKPADKIIVYCSGDAFLGNLVSKYLGTKFLSEFSNKEKMDIQKEVEIDNKKLLLGIKKVS